MTPKQRFRIALARKQPDRLPCAVSFNTETTGGLYSFGGLSAKEKIMRHLGVEDFDAVLERLGVDSWSLDPRPLPPDAEREKRWKRFQEG